MTIAIGGITRTVAKATRDTSVKGSASNSFDNRIAAKTVAMKPSVIDSFMSGIMILPKAAL